MYEYYAQLRDKFHLSDYRVAQMTGIPKSTFSAWKNGTYKPKEEKIKKLAELFNVEPKYFSDGILIEKTESSSTTKRLLEYAEGYEQALILLKQYPKLQALVNSCGKLTEKNEAYLDAVIATAEALSQKGETK